MPQTSVHGGDIYHHKIRYDFSVNINPLDVGEYIRGTMSKAALKYNTYPEAENTRLRDTIAGSEGLSREQILCGNGASELLSAAMHAFRPQKILIPQPAFAGYRWAAQMVHAQLVNYRLREENDFALTEDLLEMLTEDLDMLILTNPSNPVGRLIQPQLLLQILNRCKKKNIRVLLDECFIEFTGQESARPLLFSFDNLIILRAFTKIYGMPGVRLGYVLASENDCKKMVLQLPEWNLSLLAQETGLALMEPASIRWDRKAYIEETKTLVQQQREILNKELKNISYNDIKVYPSDANFLLLHCQRPLYEMLLQREILIRDCSNYEGLGRGYYRIAVRNQEENQYLLNAVSDLYVGHGNDGKN